MSNIHPSTKATYAAFIALAFAQLGLLSRLPDIKHQLGLSAGQLSLLLIAFASGSLVGLPLGGTIIRRFGAQRTLRVSALIALPSVVLASLAVAVHSSPVVVSLLLIPFGFGIGLWDIAMNFQGAEIEQQIGRSIMPRFHAAYSGGAVIAALVTALFIDREIPLMVQESTGAVVCALAVVWGSARFSAKTHTPKSSALLTNNSVMTRSAWLEPRTLLIGVVTLCAAFIEGVANDWTGIAFIDGHHTNTTFGVLALATFLLFWTIGRIVGTVALDRFGRVSTLRVSFALVMLGTATVVFAPVEIAYLGVAIWGLGASLGFPVGISAASDDPARSAARISVVATIGYGAFIAGPALVGFIGDQVGILKALMAVFVAACVALALTNSVRQLPSTRNS